MVPRAPCGGQGRVAAGTARRYVVTNISRKTLRARELYEQRYCVRGAMENRIKDQQRWLICDRASAHIMRANQLRMYFSAFAGAIGEFICWIGRFSSANLGFQRRS